MAERRESGGAALTSARRRLARVVTGRKVAEEALSASAREHRALLLRSLSMAAELRQLSRSLLRSHEEERKRISRELHDALGQTLTAVNIGLASLKSAPPTDPADFRRTVARTQRLLRKSMRTFQRFATSLCPPHLDELGLVPALRDFAREFGKRNGLRVGVAAPEGRAPLDGEGRTALFRVAQEALVNVGRHARARNVRVTLLRTPVGARLEVWNDGRHFDVSKVQRSRTRRHLGLLCMRERMDMVGGTFSVRSSKEHGTTVRADVPLRRNSDA